jgi:carboxymethylenebutenolidase
MVEATVQLNESILGYEFTPDAQRKAPAVLVIHEVMGVVDYVKDVARSLSDQGFAALAVDLFEGKTAKGMEDGRPLRDKVTEEVFKTKIDAGIRYLETRPYFSGKLGVIGFCMGGGFSLRTACLFPQKINACVVFYGRIDNLEVLKSLRAPVLGNFGEEDKNITTWAVEMFRPKDAFQRTLDFFDRTLK